MNLLHTKSNVVHIASIEFIADVVYPQYHKKNLFRVSKMWLEQPGQIPNKDNNMLNLRKFNN